MYSPYDVNTLYPRSIHSGFEPPLTAPTHIAVPCRLHAQSLTPIPRGPIMPHPPLSTLALSLSICAAVLLLTACDSGELSGPPGAATLSPISLNAAMNKTEICHLTGTGEFIKINVADAARDAHLGHGDGGIGDDVPGMSSFAFDELCQPILLRGILEDFESGHLDAYTVLSTLSAGQVSTEYAHDGAFGLGIEGSIWIYRDDAAVHVKQGDVISVWIMFDNLVHGRAYFGFGASSAGTLSFVLAPNTGDIRIQENNTYSSYSELSTSPQTFAVNEWYRAEVVWGTDGSIVGNLYGSDGTTLLSSVSANSTLFTEGGIAFRGFEGVKAFDTVELLP